MSVKLSPFNKVQIGLEVLGNEAYSMKQNLEAKTEIGVLPDGTNLWQTWLDSRTIRLHGGTNGDQRQRFKDDHSFDLASIVNADLSSDSSIPISEETYLKSQGAEFSSCKKSSCMEFGRAVNNLYIFCNLSAIFFGLWATPQKILYASV